MDEGAIKQSKILLSKVETIFREIDDENSLVLSCLDYIRRLARMCSFQGQSSARLLFSSMRTSNRALTTEQEPRRMYLWVALMLSQIQLPRFVTTILLSILDWVRQKPYPSLRRTWRHSSSSHQKCLTRPSLKVAINRRSRVLLWDTFSQKPFLDAGVETTFSRKRWHTPTSRKQRILTYTRWTS